MSRKGGDILVMGSVNMDLVVSVDSFPVKGETVLGKKIEYIPGGKGANQAVAAARLGSRVVFLGKVGRDLFGKKLVSFLKSEKVDVSDMETGSKPTGVAIVDVDKNGDNSIVVLQGSNSEVSIDYLSSRKEILEKSDLVIAQYEIPLDTVEYLFREVKNGGHLTILNPAPAVETPRSMWPLVDYLILNETELATLSKQEIDFDDDESIKRAAEVLHGWGAAVIVVTLGGNGALAIGMNKYLRVGGIKVKAVDTTAAGDCFVGAFAAAISNGGDLKGAVEFANRAAALSVQKAGASSSLPTKREVELTRFE